MPKLATKIPEGYGPLVHLPIEKAEYHRQSGDRVEIYGPGNVVLERDGHIVAIAAEIKWFRPAIICPLKQGVGDV